MKKFLYVVVENWDDRTDALRVFKTLKDARNAFAKDRGESQCEILRYAKVSFGEDIPDYMSCDYLFPEDKELFLPRRKERKEDN